MKPGKTVIAVDKDYHRRLPDVYPPCGTRGQVLETDTRDSMVRVRWETGITMWCFTKQIKQEGTV